MLEPAIVRVTELLAAEGLGAALHSHGKAPLRKAMQVSQAAQLLS